MKTIPTEFLPGFWITLSSGLEGRGSGFLLAENIKSVFSVDYKVPSSSDADRSWSFVSISSQELDRASYSSAFIRLITEGWLDTGSILVLGDEDAIRKILSKFLLQVAGVQDNAADHIVCSKLGKR